jgi:hypothetical protein
MTWADERILEDLAETEESLTPWMIAHDLGVDDRYVLHRCQVLANAGFLEVVSQEGQRDKFEISSWGELYLAGEIDAQNRQPCPAPRPPDKVRPSKWAGFG